MQEKLLKELKGLAAEILQLERNEAVHNLLEKAQEVQNNLAVLKFLLENEASGKQEEPIPEPIVVEDIEPIKEEISLTFDDKFHAEVGKEIDEELVKEAFLKRKTEESKKEEENLKEIFVPTFESVKEDFSLKEEFKNTVSLDETEKLFETKKEDARQLSLNDKLLNSSIQVGLNDRIAFVNSLFNFSQSEFNKELSVLNGFKTEKEAKDHINIYLRSRYKWKNKEEIIERFMLLVERKFLK